MEKKCSISKDKVMAYIKASKFTNFDDAAKDLINVKSYSDDSKLPVIKAVALIYKYLSENYPAKFTMDIAKADVILNTELETADLAKLYKQIKEVYFPSAPKAVIINNIEDIIQLAEKIKDYDDIDLINTWKIIKAAVNKILDRRSQSGKVEIKNNLIFALTRFEQVLNENTNVHPKTKTIISNDVLPLVETIQAINPYVTINETKYGQAFRIFDEKGNLVDQIYMNRDDNKYYSMEKPTVEVDLKKLEAKGFVKKPIIYDERLSGRFETVDKGRIKIISFGEMATAMKLSKFTNQDVKNNLLLTSNPNNFITVIASKVNIKQNRERLKRLQETLPGRNHETFESYEQQIALKNGDSIAAVASPTEGVSFRIEVPGTDGKVFINDLSNYVIVHPDNTTEAIDFADPNQKDKIRQYFKKQGPDNTAVELSDYDLDKLAKMQSIINLFKANATKFLEESGKDEIELPKEMYDKVIQLVKTGYSYQAAQVKEESQGALLSSALENPSNEKWMVEVDVVKVDEEENILSEEKRKVPLLVKKIKGSWVFVNGTLADDELVKHEGVLMPVESYLDKMYGDAKDIKALQPNFPKHIGYALILPKNDVNKNHQPIAINRDYGADPVTNFLKFIYALEELKIKIAQNPADQNRITKAFNIENYNFSPSYGWVADLSSYVNAKKEVSFHYEIKPMDDKTLGGNKDLKSASKLTFGQKLMDVVIDIIDKNTKTEAFKSFLAKNYPQFGTVEDLYDSKTKEKGKFFYNVVSKFIESNPELQNSIEKEYDVFTTAISKNLNLVQDKFAKQGYPLPKTGLVYTMLENEKSDFSGRWFLKVNDKSVGLDHMNLDQFRLVTTSELSKATEFTLGSPIDTYLSDNPTSKPIVPVDPVTPAPTAPVSDIEAKRAEIERIKNRILPNQQKRLEDAKEIATNGTDFNEALNSLQKKSADARNRANERLKKEATKEGVRPIDIQERLDTYEETKEAERYDYLIKQINDYYTEGKSENFVTSSQFAITIEENEIEKVNKRLEKSNAELAALEGGKQSGPVNLETNNDDYVIDDSDEIAPFSIVGANEEVVLYNDKSYKDELDWFKSNLPSDLSVGDLEEIISKLNADGRVLGYYKDQIAYVSKTMSGVGSIYHEAFHGVFRNILSESDRRYYIGKALQEIGPISKTQVDEFRKMRGQFHLTDAQVIQSIAEEHIAEKFRSYKLNSTLPKSTWLKKLVLLLDKIFRFFTGRSKEIDDITELFRKIDTGYYKNARVISGFKNEGVFQLIPSRPIITDIKADGKPLIKSTHFNTYEQNQLLHRLAFEVSNSPMQKFDEKFDSAVSKLLGEFDIERLIAANPSLDADKIRDKYTELYDDIRFALGDPFSKYKTVSGLDEHTRLVSKADKDSLDVRSLLKAEVKGILSNIDIKVALDSDNFSFSEEDNDEDKPNGSFEENIANLNPLNGLSGEFRKFFSLLPYDMVDKDTGVTVRKMIDGGNIFDAVMKISADVPYDMIIENLKFEIDTLKDDNYNTDAYEKLNTVYKYLNNMLELDENFKPTKNINFYNQLLNTFFVTEVPTLIYHPNTNSDYGTRGNVYDATIQRDISREVERLKLTYTSNFFRYSTSEKKKIFDIAAREIKQVLFANNDLQTEKSSVLEEKATIVQNALSLLGLNFSKSLIKFSLVNIDQENNPLKEFHPKTKAAGLIRSNSVLANTGAYLKKDFFKWVFGDTLGPNVNIFERTDYDQVGVDPEDMEEMDIIKLDRSEEQKIQINGINGMLREAARFMVKYNPDAAVSVFQNAEGKNVYRYLKYTPLLLMAQTVKLKGLDGLIEKYPIFEDFFKDNPYYSNGKDKAAELYLKNFYISMLGGTRQSIDGMEKEGVTFKGMDPRSKQIADLLMFSNRKIVKSGKTEIVIYDRSHSILEATSTNFLVPGLYKQLYTKEGFMKDENENTIVIEMMMESIKQEYNRIQREWSTREERKQTGDKRNHDGYNSKKGKDGKINTESDELRAYNFQTFKKFFGKTSYQAEDAIQTQRTAIGDRLVEMAKSGIPFKDILKKQTHADTVSTLKNLLEGYAIDEFNDYLENLKITGVLQENPDGKSYSTVLIPNSVKTGVNKYSSHESMGMDMQSFLADYFYNDWMSRTFTSQFFDGDAAVTTESATKYGLRNRFTVIKGDSMRDGFHTVAYIDKIKVWMHKTDIEAGQYDNEEDIPEEYKQKDNWKDDWELKDVADGQSYSTLEHRIFMYGRQGRIEEKKSTDDDDYHVYTLLQKARIDRLEPEEIQFLEKYKIVLGSYKTATGGMIEYHKLSEHIILRPDVSYIIPLAGSTVYKTKAYIRELLNEADIIKEHLINGNEHILLPEYNATPREALKSIYEAIHLRYAPQPGRQSLHYMLNSMELDSVDQLIDINASKKGTLLSTAINKNDITDLSVALKTVPNEFKFMQLETSGVSRKITNPTQKQQLIDAAVDENSPKKIKEIVKDYRRALQLYSDLSLSEIELILDRPEGDVNITPIITTMRKGLEKQGADANMLKFFEIDPLTNKPVFNINLPSRKAMFQNYFMALYSDNVFGSKVSGRKDFEVSSFGYKVVVDENDQVIRQDIIDEDPAKYSGYKTRYPGVRKEINKDGTIKYIVEVLIPKPMFKNKQHEELFLAKLSEMLSTRIPTEDYRSMIVCKAVDYIDGAYQNSIVLPQLIHKLAGSDLDIDALYSQTLATYEDFNGDTHIYGDYSSHKNITTEQARFLEYIINKSESAVFEGDIDLEYNKIMSDPDLVGELPDAMDQLKDYLGLPGLGITKANIRTRLKELNQERKSYYENYLAVKEQRKFAHEQYVKIRMRNYEIWKPAFDEVVKDLRAAGEVFDETDEDFQHSVLGLIYQRLSPEQAKELNFKEQGAASARLRETVQQAKRSFESMTGTSVELQDAKKEAKRVIKMFEKQMRMIATLNVLAKYKQPVNINDFRKNTKVLVKEVLQNRSMQSQIDILSSEFIYNNYYKDESTNVEYFENLTKSLNDSIDDKIEKYDRHTPTYVANVMAINSNSEDGIGIAAVMNKAAAFLTKYNIRIAKPIWTINNIVFNEYTRDAALNENEDYSERVIKKIGTALGMFADAKKEPYPAILNLNKTTSSISLGMIAQGIDENLAYLINKVPLIEKAIKETDKSASSVQSLEEYYRRSSLKKTLKGYLGTEVAKIVKDKRGEELFKKDKNGKATNKFREIEISYSFDETPRKRETLEDLGFTAVYKGTDTLVNEDVLQLYLLSSYIEQIGLNSDVLALGQILNLIKKQEPSWDNLDNIVRSYMYLTNRLQTYPNFTNMKNVLEKEAKEYIPLIKSVMHLFTTAEKVFLERNPVFKVINEELEASMWSFNMSDGIKSGLNSYPVKFLLINKFKQRTVKQLQEEESSKTPNLEKIEILKTRLSILGADFWMNKETEITGTFEEDINYLHKTHPGNAFTNFLKTKSINGIIFTEALSRMKLDGELTNNIIDGYNSLRRSLDKKSRIIADKLYMYILVKDNLGMSNNSFVNYLNPEVYIPISKDLDEIQKVLNKALVSSSARKQIVTGEPFKKFFENPKLDMSSMMSTIFYKALSFAGNKPFLHSSRKFIPGAIKGPLSNKLSRLNTNELLNLMAEITPTAVAVNLNELYDIKNEERIYDVYTPTSTEIDKGEAIINLTSLQDPGDQGLPKNQEEITRALKTYPAYKYESDGKKTFVGWSFPASVVNSEGQILRLDSIDGKPLGQYLIEKLNDRLENTRLNSDYSISGFKAVYKVSQFEGNGKILNTSFTTEEARDLYEYVESSKKYSMVKTTEEFDHFLLKLYNKHDVSINHLEILQKWIKKDFAKYGFIKLGSKGVFSLKYSVPVSEYEKDNEYLIEVTPSKDIEKNTALVITLYSITNGARRELEKQEVSNTVEFYSLSKEERKEIRRAERQKIEDEKADEAHARLFGMTVEEAIERGLIENKKEIKDAGSLTSVTSGEEFKFYTQLIDYIKNIKEKKDLIAIVKLLFTENNIIVKTVTTPDLFNNIDEVVQQREAEGFKPEDVTPGDAVLPEFLKSTKPSVIKNNTFTDDELKVIYEDSASKRKGVEYDVYKKKAIESIDTGIQFGLGKKDIIDALKCL